MRQTWLPKETPRWIGGIDEAGRGAAIGPLIIVGVALPETKLEKLVSLEVKDSKQLSPEKRNELFEKIKKLPIKWELAEISPRQIDEVLRSKSRNLNQLELQHMARICLSLAPDIVYVDALGPDAQEFEVKLREMIQREEQRSKNGILGKNYSIDRSTDEQSNLQIIGSHRADELYPVVSAASILAKVQRDRRIEKLKVEFDEDFGSGYPSDPQTRAALRSWVTQGAFPDFVRKKWKTIQELRDELSRSKTRPLNRWIK